MLTITYLRISNVWTVCNIWSRHEVSTAVVACTFDQPAQETNIDAATKSCAYIGKVHSIIYLVMILKNEP